MSYHATNDDKNYWVLGFRDICSKSAKDTLTTFKDLLNDISKTADRNTESESHAANKSVDQHQEHHVE